MQQDSARTDTNNYAGMVCINSCRVNDPVKGYIFRATFNVTNPLPLYTWVQTGTNPGVYLVQVLTSRTRKKRMD